MSNYEYIYAFADTHIYTTLYLDSFSITLHRYQICYSASNLSSSAVMSWKQKILLTVMLLFMYITFIPLISLYKSNVIRFDIVGFYLAILALIIPIGFLITGCYMFSILRKTNQKISPFSLKVGYIIIVFLILFFATLTVYALYDCPLH